MQPEAQDQPVTQPAPAPAPAPMPEAMPTPAHHTAYESNPFKLIRPSFEGFKLNWRALVLLILIVAGLIFAAVVVTVVTYMATQSLGTTVLVGLAAFLAYMYFAVVKLTPAGYRIQLAMGRHQKIAFKQALDFPAVVGWKIVWTGILGGLIVLVGLLLLIIPGLIFMIWFSQANFVVVEEGLSGWAALKRSRDLVRNRFVDTLGALSIPSAANIFDIIPGIGSLVSLAAVFTVMAIPAIRYDQLVALKKTGDGTGVATNAANYGAIVLAVIAISLSYGQSARDLQNQRSTDLNLPSSTLDNSSSPY